MEELDASTVEELRRKAIERDGSEEDVENDLQEELKEPEVEDLVEMPKKKKRERSEKQKAAFEKARQKRAENLKIKKQLEAEKKEQKKAEKEQVKKEVEERISQDKLSNQKPPTVQRTRSQEPMYREQVVNNYYYYGQPAEWRHHQSVQGYPDPYQQIDPRSVETRTSMISQSAGVDPVKVKSKRKKKVVVKEPEPETESESEEEEEEIIEYQPQEPADEPQGYKELQNYTEDIKRPPKPNNGLKFRFA